MISPSYVSLVALLQLPGPIACIFSTSLSVISLGLGDLIGDLIGVRLEFNR